MICVWYSSPLLYRLSMTCFTRRGWYIGSHTLRPVENVGGFDQLSISWDHLPGVFAWWIAGHKKWTNAVESFLSFSISQEVRGVNLMEKANAGPGPSRWPIPSSRWMTNLWLHEVLWPRVTRFSPSFRMRSHDKCFFHKLKWVLCVSRKKDLRDPYVGRHYQYVQYRYTLYWYLEPFRIAHDVLPRLWMIPIEKIILIFRFLIPPTQECAF